MAIFKVFWQLFLSKLICVCVYVCVCVCVCVRWVEVLIDTKERKRFAGKISLFVEESDNFIIQVISLSNVYSKVISLSNHLLSLLSKWDPISLMY